MTPLQLEYLYSENERRHENDEIDRIKAMPPGKRDMAQMARIMHERVKREHNRSRNADRIANDRHGHASRPR
jgi:hypothetical protein